MRTSLFSLACSVVLAISFPVAAQSPRVPEPREISEAKKNFAKTEKEEREVFLKKFDTAVTILGRTPGLPNEVKLARQKEIQNQKKAFEKDGTLPGCDDMLVPMWDHLYRLHTARKPVAFAYDAALKKCTQAGDTETGLKLANEKAKYDEKLPGRDTFQANTHWRGHRAIAGNNLDFALHVESCEGNAVKGRMWQERGKPSAAELVVEGKLDGNYIQLKRVKVVKGKPRDLRFAGFVMEDRLVFQVSGVAVNGHPAGGVVLLNRDKK